MKHLVTGRPDLVSKWHEICDKQERDKREWCERLRREGIKAAHPDDGWVDREDNYLIFAYPQFRDKVEIGDQIALGWPNKWRIVRVTQIDDTHGALGLTRYYFEDLPQED